MRIIKIEKMTDNKPAFHFYSLLSSGVMTIVICRPLMLTMGSPHGIKSNRQMEAHNHVKVDRIIFIKI